MLGGLAEGVPNLQLYCTALSYNKYTSGFLAVSKDGFLQEVIPPHTYVHQLPFIETRVYTVTQRSYVVGRQIVIGLSPLSLLQFHSTHASIHTKYVGVPDIQYILCGHVHVMWHSLIIFSSSDCSPMVWNLKEPRCWANVCCIFEYSVQCLINSMTCTVLTQQLHKYTITNVYHTDGHLW